MVHIIYFFSFTQLCLLVSDAQQDYDDQAAFDDLDDIDHNDPSLRSDNEIKG